MNLQINIADLVHGDISNRVGADIRDTVWRCVNASQPHSELVEATLWDGPVEVLEHVIWHPILGTLYTPGHRH